MYPDLSKMKTVTLKIPDVNNDYDLKMYLAGQLFENGILSSGQAADFVGISKRKFLESIGNYGISIFGEKIGDIEKLLNE